MNINSLSLTSPGRGELVLNIQVWALKICYLIGTMTTFVNSNLNSREELKVFLDGEKVEQHVLLRAHSYHLTDLVHVVRISKTRKKRGRSRKTRYNNFYYNEWSLEYIFKSLRIFLIPRCKTFITTLSTNVKCYRLIIIKWNLSLHSSMKIYHLLYVTSVIFYQ